jgi:hypothetical protein
MENQDISTGAQQAAPAMQSMDAAFSLHKLQKQERRLIERLHEAQEAEARALERFQRAQAKLERRKARIQRLEHRLTRIKEELTNLAASEHATSPAAQSEQPAELPTNGYQPGEQVPDSLLSGAPAGPAGTPVPPTPESEEGNLEPEHHVTPELVPSPEPLPSNEPALAPEPSFEEKDSQPGAEPSLATPPVIDEDHSEPAAEASLTPELSVEENHREPPAEPSLASSPVIDENHHEPAAEAPQLPSYDEAGPVEEIAPPPPVSKPQEVEASVEHEIQPAQPGQPVQTISLAALEQALIEAREVLQMIEASVDLAQRRRDELAKSISFLAQANLSGALMDELLHKQAEANRAWNDAKEQEHIARNRLAHAEAAYYEAQS